MDTPASASSEPNAERIDPKTGLQLPDPFSDYIPCPHCGEAEVEVWCYQAGGKCHNCGEWVAYEKPAFCGVAPWCKRGTLTQDQQVPTPSDPPKT